MDALHTLTSPATRSSANTLLGRRNERHTIQQLLQGAREGTGGTLVIHGEPGTGKTALLDDAASAADDFQIARTSGVEGEMELPFAAVQQLCSPFLEQTKRLPRHQRHALDVAFGLDTGPAPDAFFVGLAVLGVLSEAADHQPLLAVVDDAQWLDDASARATAFMARRLTAERIAVVFAARQFPKILGGLTGLPVGPLANRDARKLLESSLPGPLDERVLDRIAAEARGNPLALLELPRGLTPAQLAGGFGLPTAAPLPLALEQSFNRRMASLPADSRRLLLLAAADPLGDPELLWDAAAKLGIPHSAADAIEAAGLMEAGTRVAFRHPLVRSAIYTAAGASDRRAVHHALAEVTDPHRDPDHRAWHLAQTATMPDESIATELQRSAGRVQARGGSAAVAAFLERAAVLTPNAARRARRLLEAADAKRIAGDQEGALELSESVEADLLDELQRGRLQLLLARIALEQSRAADAGRLFLNAARSLEPVDPELARETYLEALSGSLASDIEIDGGAQAVAAAAQSAPAGPKRPVDLMLSAFATRVTDGYAAAAPRLAETLNLLLALDVTDEHLGRWFSTSGARNANVVALEMWDDEAVHLLAARQVQFARDTGMLGHLHFALSFLARSQMLAGEFQQAGDTLEEARFIAKATRNPELVNAPMILSAWRGREPDASTLIDASSKQAAERRWISNDYARSVLANGLGHHEQARDAARDAMRTDPIGYGTFLVPELAEGASRSGDRPLLEHTLRWLSTRTGAIESPWASGIEARVRALLSEADTADTHYRESIRYLSGTRARVELARSHLLYGEWLRRQRRRLDARKELRTALEEFAGMGAEAFASRAERELLATGERARKRTNDTADELTPQETQIARLAANGQRNREIAAQLFISTSTVDYHLRKVYRKLGVKSRTQLAQRLN
jgi:DNA-binding CsgD family transcriptional regulator